MKLLTTTLGSFPKPAYVPVMDWFREENMTKVLLQPNIPSVRAHSDQLLASEYDMLLDKATREAINIQVQAGIDIPTDGEMRRENYVHYHCRHLQGFDFTQLVERVMRAGTWKSVVPVIVSDITSNGSFLVRDWRIAQSFTSRPVKMTLPGPMTISDSVADEFYKDEQKLGDVLADALNAEIQALADGGCRWIQLDEPVLLRYPRQALSYGIEHVVRCFRGVGSSVRRVLHVCRGYPNRLDHDHYPRAPVDSYLDLATALSSAEIDVLCLEGTEDEELQILERFSRQVITLGVVEIGRSRVESVDEIVARLERALDHIDDERLMVSPNCGMGMLGTDSAVAKLINMVKACEIVDQSW